MPAALALCLLLASGAAQTQAARVADLAFYAGPERSERLIAGAKKEASLTRYTSLTLDDMKVVGGAFAKKYGVKVNLWRASSQDILQRAVMEAHGGRFDVDAIETSAAAMESPHREKLLPEVQSPYLGELSPAALLPHREWVGDRLNFITAAYNTNLVRKADLPQSYDDLLQARWKGKLTIEGEDSLWFGAVISALGAEKGLALFRALARRNGLSPRKRHSLIASLVASGEVPFTITAYPYRIEQMKKDGAPLEWLMLPPVISRFLGTGVLRRAPTRAAILFLDFMLADARRLLLERGIAPTNIKLRPLDIAFKVIDPAEMLEEADKWAKLFDAIVLKGGR